MAGCYLFSCGFKTVHGAKYPCPFSSLHSATAVTTHRFPGTAAGHGAGFDEVLPEQVFAGVRTIQ